MFLIGKMFIYLFLAGCVGGVAGVVAACGWADDAFCARSSASERCSASIASRAASLRHWPARA